MQSTRPAAKICSEAAVRSEKKQHKTKTNQNFQLQKTSIRMFNFPHWTTYFICCPRTCIRSLSLISLASRGWYSSKNSLGILLLVLCSMCGLLLSRHTKCLSRRNKAAGYLNVTGSWVSHEVTQTVVISNERGVKIICHIILTVTVQLRRMYYQIEYGDNLGRSIAFSFPQNFQSLQPRLSMFHHKNDIRCISITQYTHQQQQWEVREGECLSKSKRIAVCKQNLHLIPSDPKDSNIIQD